MNQARLVGFLKLATASARLYALAPDAPSLIAMVLIWSKNSCPSLQADACTARGTTLIDAAAQRVESTSDAGLLLNLLQVHGLRGCEAMQHAGTAECTLDALRSAALTRRLESVPLYEQALRMASSTPLDADLLMAAADAAAIVGLATTEETVETLLALASLPTAPPSVAVAALNAYLELCAAPNVSAALHIMLGLESRIDNVDAATRFSELLERWPLRVGGQPFPMAHIAASLCEPERYATSLLAHNDAPLQRIRTAVAFTDATLAATSHTRPHMAFPLHQFAHVPDSLRQSGYWLRWRFLLAHAARVSDSTREAARRHASELLASKELQLTSDEAAIDEAFAGAPLTRLAGYLAHAFSREFDSCRYLPFPLTLPPGSWIFRGIGDRLGGPLSEMAVANLLARGCGPADLTRAPPNAEQIFGALWLKVGQTFTSVALSKALRFTSMPGDGAMMAIRADYFHAAQRSGRCRVEKEYAFNPVLYDPIPNFAIEHIWLPKAQQRRVLWAAYQDRPDNPAEPVGPSSEARGLVEEFARSDGGVASLANSLVAPMATLSRAVRNSSRSSNPPELLRRLHFVEPGADLTNTVSESCPPVNLHEMCISTLAEIMLCIEHHRRPSADV